MITPPPAPSVGPPAPLLKPLVEAHGIVKRYGPTTALQDGQLTVLPGESHALVGRNGAGKSTLVRILTGLQAPDAGTVRFDGDPAPPLADRDAWRTKVACVYQHPTVVPELTVAENLFINRQPAGRGGFISWRRLKSEAAAVLDTWDVRVDSGARTADLSVEDRQMVEIARALSFGARFIVLDEPTAQLDNREIERLFTRMRALQESGVTFLFISHHLQEVYEVCQTVTVLRDARWITTAPVAELPRAALVEAMAGSPWSTVHRGYVTTYATTHPCSSTRRASAARRTRTSRSPSAAARSSASPDPAAAARSSSPRPSPDCTPRLPEAPKSPAESSSSGT